MILKLLYIIYSKSAKMTLSVCVAVGKFVCDVNGGNPVRSFFVYVETVRLLNLSAAALVAGFTRISLHNVITSFIISRSGLGSSFILTTMSSKQK